MKKAQTKKSTKGGQSKTRKKGGSWFPQQVQWAIYEDYLAGETKAAIAKKHGHDRTTVKRIIDAKEMEEFGKKVMERFLARITNPAMSRIEHEVVDWRTKMGGVIAMDLAERFGMIPPKINRNANWNKEDRGIPGSVDKTDPRYWLTKMVDHTVDKARIYGSRLPDVDNVLTEKEREQYEAEIGEEEMKIGDRK